MRRLAAHPEGDGRTLAGGKTAKRSPPPEKENQNLIPTGITERYDPCRGRVALEIYPVVAPAEAGLPPATVLASRRLAPAMTLHSPAILRIWLCL